MFCAVLADEFSMFKCSNVLNVVCTVLVYGPSRHAPCSDDGVDIITVHVSYALYRRSWGPGRGKNFTGSLGLCMSVSML